MLTKPQLENALAEAGFNLGFFLKLALRDARTPEQAQQYAIDAGAAAETRGEKYGAAILHGIAHGLSVPIDGVTPAADKAGSPR